MKILSRLNVCKDFADWFSALLVDVQDRNNAWKVKFTLVRLERVTSTPTFFFPWVCDLIIDCQLIKVKNCLTGIWQCSRQLGSCTERVLRSSLRFKLVVFACCARTSNVFTLCSWLSRLSRSSSEYWISLIARAAMLKVEKGA